VSGAIIRKCSRSSVEETFLRVLERFPAKWVSVRLKKTRQSKNLAPNSKTHRTRKIGFDAPQAGLTALPVDDPLLAAGLLSGRLGRGWEFLLTRFLPQISLRNLRKLDCYANRKSSSLENAL
jgi:hypothetical protein